VALRNQEEAKPFNSNYENRSIYESWQRQKHGGLRSKRLPRSAPATGQIGVLRCACGGGRRPFAGFHGDEWSKKRNEQM
jgi:hypothetical protein